MTNCDMTSSVFAPFRLLRQQEHLNRLAVMLVNSPRHHLVVPGTAFPQDWLKIWNGARCRYCTDGAANRLLESCKARLTKCPEVIVGDMDSIKEQAKQFFEAISTCELRRMPDQNSTDLTKTLKVILDKHLLLVSQQQNGLSGIVVLGGFHGRFDHVLGTLHSFVMHVQQQQIARIRVPLFAIDGENILTVLPEGKTEALLDPDRVTGTCGLFPIVQRPVRISTRGFKWNLDDHPLEYGSLVSSSNHALEPEKLSITSRGGPIVFTFELREPNRVI